MSNTTATEVSPDAVYAHLSAEMRRYRDYELTVSTWYTVILLAALGFLVKAMLDTPATPSKRISPLADVLLTNPVMHALAALIIILIAGGAVYCVRYGNLRYEELLPYFRRLRPHWDTLTTTERRLKPVHLIYFTHFLILASTTAVIASPRGLCAVEVGLLLVVVMYWLILGVLLRKPKQ